MPIFGWRIGSEFQPIVQSFDHWIAFVILSTLGIKMILDGLRPSESAMGKVSFTLVALILTAIATSIDALVAGFGFGVLSVSVLSILLAIGGVTFITSAAGMYIGNRLGARVGIFAEVGAGLILIGVGIRILLSHLAA
jgi:manganese efflux pump family protein